MRTDPHADEVRSIVERVFSGFFQKRRMQESDSSPLYGGLLSGRLRFEERKSIAGMRCNERGLAGKFPRLYCPAEEDEDIDPVLPEIDETILIDQGQYVARSYRMEGYMAMWLVPVGLVQFYDDEGRMLATISLFESLRPQRMAA
ncbi:MAG: hypothetical protein WCJ35_13030 [Planctomycetota bacterium]